MKHWQPISDEQRAYIVAHKDELPRRAVARAAGVSLSSLYRVIREAGGKMHPERNTRDDERWEIVRKYFPVMSGREMAKKFGWPERYADKVAKKLGIEHTAETKQRLSKKMHDCMKSGWTHVNRQRQGERTKALYRMERLRVESGMAQRTKLRLSKITPKGRQAKHRMTSVYNYFGIGREEAHIVCYDSETRRNLKLEEKYSHYGLVFLPADDMKEEEKEAKHGQRHADGTDVQGLRAQSQMPEWTVLR